MSVDFAFIDSGTGGLPYMNHLRSVCPDARCVYVADTAHFPYGEKTPEQVIACAAGLVGALIQKLQPAVIVLACNTMSVTGLEALRSMFPRMPFVGTVPAVKLAASVTRNRRIGLLATDRTVRDSYTQKLIGAYARGCTVYKRGDGELVSFIEHRYFTAGKEERMQAVMPAAAYFRKKDADTVILGCTHFIHAAQDMKDALGPGIQVIDSRDGVVRQALKISGRAPSAQRESIPGDFYVTGTTIPSAQACCRSLCAKFNMEWKGSLF